MSVMTRSGCVARHRFDQFAAGPGDGDDLVAQERQDLLEVVAHVGLVVGDGDLEGTGHGGPLGRVMRKTAPGPSPSPDGDLAAVGLDDPLGDGHAQAGALGLGGEERVEDCGRCSGGDARPVVADGDAGSRAGPRGRRPRPRTSTATGGEQAARALSRMLRKTCSSRNGSATQRRSTPSSLLAQRGLASPAGELQVGPGLAPDRREVARAPVELDRGGVAADVLVEVLEVVLGLLDAGRSGRAPRAGRGRPGRASRGRPGCAAGRCGSRGPGRRPSGRWRPAARPAAPAPGPA